MAGCLNSMHGVLGFLSPKFAYLERKLLSPKESSATQGQEALASFLGALCWLKKPSDASVYFVFVQDRNQSIVLSDWTLHLHEDVALNFLEAVISSSSDPCVCYSTLKA